MEAPAALAVTPGKIGNSRETPQPSNNKKLPRSRSGKSVRSWHHRAVRNLQVDEPSLLRGMPAAFGVRSFASVLSDAPATEQYFELSAPVDVDAVTPIDTFVSHNWSTPRWQKFLVLIFHFNMRLAYATSTVVAAAACVLTSHGLLPTTTVWIYLAEKDETTQGVLCMPLGLLAFAVTLVCLRDLDRGCLPMKPHLVFLDRTCVHQVDAALKQKGIRCLAAYLQKSRDILILYSDVYLQRLWTCYEIASWLMLHPDERIILRSVMVPVILACGCLCGALLEALLFVSYKVDLGTAIEPVPGFSVLLLCLVPALSLGTWLAAHWRADLERIEKHVARFSFVDALCASEDDRSIVQQNIIDFAKFVGLSDAEAGDDEVFHDFEELVRKELPSMIWAVFGRIGPPYHWVCILTLPHMLVAFDYVAGVVVVGEPVRSIVLHTLLQGAITSLTLVPLVIAGCFALTRYNRLRNPVGCFGIGTLGTGCLATLVIGFDAVVQEAVHSNEWLAAYVVLVAAAVGLTAMAYWPNGGLLPACRR